MTPLQLAQHRALCSVPNLPEKTRWLLERIALKVDLPLTEWQASQMNSDCREYGINIRAEQQPGANVERASNRSSSPVGEAGQLFEL